MSVMVGRLHLPRVTDGPLAAPHRRSGEPDEDWSEIEALLASPAPAYDRAGSRSRRGRAASVIASSLAVSLVFGGLLAGGVWGLQRGCDSQAAGSCASAATLAAEAATAPTPTNQIADAGAARRRAVAGRPASVATAAASERVAQYEAPPNDARLTEGRSSSEADVKGEDRPPAVALPRQALLPPGGDSLVEDDAPGAASSPPWHARFRRHHAWMHRHRHAWR